MKRNIVVSAIKWAISVKALGFIVNFCAFMETRYSRVLIWIQPLFSCHEKFPGPVMINIRKISSFSQDVLKFYFKSTFAYLILLSSSLPLCAEISWFPVIRPIYFSPILFLKLLISHLKVLSSHIWYEKSTAWIFLFASISSLLRKFSLSR